MNDSVQWSEGLVDNDGVQLHFYRTGRADRPSVVMAHGFSDNGLCWRRVATSLAPDFDLVMVDARCHGKSAAIAGLAHEQASDIVAVVNQLGLEQPALIGHSVGANTMATAVADYPGLASTLILEDPPWRARPDGAPSHERPDPKAIDSYLRSLGSMDRDQLADLARSEHPTWSPEEYADWIEAKTQVRQPAGVSLTPIDWGITAPRLSCPTLLVCGQVGLGALLTPAVAAAVCKENRSVTSEVIEDAGHNVRRENFDSYLDTVSTFLEQN